MTTLAKTDDYLRILLGMGLVWALFPSGTIHGIPHSLSAAILVVPITFWMVAAGYGLLIKKIQNLLAFPVF